MSRLSPIPGFKEFLSSDPCFPVAISYPQDFRGPFDSTIKKGHIITRWEGGPQKEGLRIDLESLEMFQANRNVQLLLDGQANITPLMQELMADLERVALSQDWRYYPRKPRTQDKVIGSRYQPIRAKRLVWLKPSQQRFTWLTSSGEYGGEWVFFLLSRRGNEWLTSTTTFDRRAQNRQLFVFKNCHTCDACVSENVFDAFLSSFRLLPAEFFRS